jgi:hypothetical protein
MPNHVTNRVFVSGNTKELQKFKKEMFKSNEYNEWEFDFNNIIQSPKELEGIISGCCHIDGKSVEKWRMVDGESVEITEEESKKLKEKYHADCILDWNRLHWGTKWNAYRCSLPFFSDTEERELEFSFHTAWTFPEPIFNKLPKIYPNLEFKVAFFDEGWGFAGEGEFSEDCHSLDYCEADEELYEKVYDRPAPEDYEEDEED